MALKALIWDVGGTMTDNEELHRAAFNEAFADAGLAWRWTRRMYADLLRTTGGKERIAAHLRATHPADGTNTDLESMIKVLHAHKKNHFLQPVPGRRSGRAAT
ncbi:hypothetical protein [Desulfonatronum sp. SC1]|uniref:hypothetical protein n=1 Tax=Desulfonatronum sp. SC1 TaxID=2109626 RepID=UPI0011B20D45|nr:hypothetical protein [Desulfonatronum sp. SC1]